MDQTLQGATAVLEGHSAEVSYAPADCHEWDIHEDIEDISTWYAVQVIADDRHTSSMSLVC